MGIIKELLEFENNQLRAAVAERDAEILRLCNDRDRLLAACRLALTDLRGDSPVRPAIRQAVAGATGGSSGGGEMTQERGGPS